MQLSQTEGLQWFTTVILASSDQDSFVPFDSARMEISKRTADSSNAPIFQEMVNNLQKQLLGVNLHKMNINFVQGKDSNLFEDILGKTAHF